MPGPDAVGGDVFRAKDAFPHRDRNHGDPMSGAGTKDKKPRLAEHEVEHVVSIMEMVRV